MQTIPLRSKRFKPGIGDYIDDLLDTLLADRLAVQHRAAVAQGIEARPCDGCDLAPPGVDLWAEDSETGEQLWLCPACGDS